MDIGYGVGMASMASHVQYSHLLLGDGGGVWLLMDMGT